MKFDYEIHHEVVRDTEKELRNPYGWAEYKKGITLYSLKFDSEFVSALEALIGPDAIDKIMKGCRFLEEQAKTLVNQLPNSATESH